MSTDTATLPTVCAACRSTGELRVEQRLDKGTLRWSESFACACGHGFEAKNGGLPTPAARQALMLAHGAFRVFVEAIPRGGRALAVLAKVLDAREAEVAAALERLPALVWEGTRAESSFMRQALEQSGATVSVEPVAVKAPAPRPSAKRAKKR